MEFRGRVWGVGGHVIFTTFEIFKVSVVFDGRETFPNFKKQKERNGAVRQFTVGAGEKGSESVDSAVVGAEEKGFVF